MSHQKTKMNKKTSLSVLIKHSLFLSDEAKKTLLDRLSKMTEDEILKLGTFLALEKKESLRVNQDVDTTIKQILDLSTKH